MKLKKTLILLLLGFSLFSLSGYTRYSAVGIDHDELRQDQVYYHYYRIYWSGYGSLFIGRGTTQRKQPLHKPLEYYDPAAVFLRKPHKKTPIKQSIWNQLGFWWVDLKLPHSQQSWMGIPAGFPLLILSLWWAYRRKKSHP